MTLNSTIQRLRSICLAHKQVRRFFKGFAQDFLTAHTDQYPGVLLQDSDGGISFEGRATTLNFSLMCVDLVHVSEDSKTNEQDVHSDMLSVILDLLAQMNSPGYTDWRVKAGNIQLVSEQDGDMYAGVRVDIEIQIMYTQNACAAPMNEIVEE